MLKKELKNHLFPLNLQYFAEGENNNPDNNSEGDNGNSSEQNNNNDNKDQSDNKTGERTFTQSQVNNMMAKEKHEGKNAILKSLGFKTEEEAKSAMALYTALINSQKSQEEQNKENLDKANSEKEEYFVRAENAENKLSCFEAGVSKDSVDDVLAIAKTKLTDGKTLSDVLSEMKKDKRYSAFFESSNGSSNGTGSQPGHSGGSGDSKPGDYGKRLAESSKRETKTETKSNFF